MKLKGEVSEAEKAVEFAKDNAVRDAANAVNETEFGIICESLNGTPYAHHSKSAQVLLDGGADAQARNSAKWLITRANTI